MVAVARDENGLARLPDIDADGTGLYLSSLDCFSFTSCIAVGSKGGAAARRWDGAQWIDITANAPVGHGLTGLSCAGPDDCIAVTSPGSPERSAIHHWNGRSWALTYPAPWTRPATVAAVSCAGDSFCLAFGEQATRWDGTSWRPLADGNPVRTSGIRHGRVSCASPSFCLVLGDPARDDQGVTATPVVRWDGSRLQAMPQPGGSLVGFELSVVTCAGEQFCLAIGTATYLGFRYAAATRWDGRSWGAVPAPGHAITGLSCLSPTACTAVGVDRVNGPLPAPDPTPPSIPGTTVIPAAPPVTLPTPVPAPAGPAGPFATTPPPRPRPRAVAFSWDGTAWRDMGMPGIDRQIGVALDSVSCPTPSTCVAAGWAEPKVPGGSGDGTSPLTATWDGIRWRLAVRTMVDKRAAYRSVSCSSSTRCTAVGMTGRHPDAWTAHRPITAVWNGNDWLDGPAVPLPAAGALALQSVSCAGAMCRAVGDASFLSFAPKGG